MTTILTSNMTNTKPEFRENFFRQGYSFYQPLSQQDSLPLGGSYQTPDLNLSFLNKQNRGNCELSKTSSHNPQISLVEPGRILNLRPFKPTSSLKRSSSHIDLSPYNDYTQNTKEDLSNNQKPKINQDHQLLSFAKIPETHTLIDDQDRVQRIDLTAQLHGMFFLSELASTPDDTTTAKPELTCYRRNLFQISGSVTLPHGALSYMTERGEKIPLISMEANISATESIDGHSVKLIVIPWKTPPPNSPEIDSNHEHEPTTIPLTAYNSNTDINHGTICSPIAYRRLQFRIATANNGRRRELQQHFNLHLTVVGALADGSRISVCKTSTAPIVVRGRSPRNFQARKGIPLLGSSSSRGNPPELQMAMNLMARNALVENKTKNLTNQKIEQSLELSGVETGIGSNTIVNSPSLACLESYPSWDITYPIENHSSPNYFRPNLMISDTFINHQGAPTDISPSITSPDSVSSQSSQLPFISYHPFSPTITVNQDPHYSSNHRTAKSPRCLEPPEKFSPNSYLDVGCRYPETFNVATFMTSAPIEEYFPPSEHINWLSEVETAPLYENTNSNSVLQSYE
ncbi:putative ndt80 like dna-binding family protein [Golovinomyces cichoracearum]|uniref:Putative ndt80 like dna-binding family protein n=1 Tax=Golovinomyces cichoracearum TaxID=62708 RepID=A0A420IAX2_9PEZI|nr:putative ndt80 like dna-binding family protein [Golovinomyces cichoracearum]